MGKYGGGNGYEQAIYDELWNGVAVFLRDLKTAGRMRIINPRPQITLAVHTHTIVTDLVGMRIFVL